MQDKSITELNSEFQTLVEIVQKLRGPNGCPWDKEQTQKSLTQFIIEEAHELVEAIEGENQIEIKEELGDFLFQVILQAQVADDENHFKLTDVIHNLNQKLINRHPHVFKANQNLTSNQVWENWHKMKAQETKEKKKEIFSIPVNLPSLQSAYKIGRKTQGFKFDWEHPLEVIEKVKEELEEVIVAQKNAIDNPASIDHLESEIGDLLFSAAQLARHNNLDPEACLRKTNQKFINRFKKVLELSNVSLDDFQKISTAQKENLWKKAKLEYP